ncbi:MAG: hypothetical protein Q4B54_08665 [Coriobacteriales bacterium]|nr:hypothetical protein [Coriobacteriales bacterium]
MPILQQGQMPEGELPELPEGVEAPAEGELPELPEGVEAPAEGQMPQMQQDKKGPQMNKRGNTTVATASTTE